MVFSPDSSSDESDEINRIIEKSPSLQRPTTRSTGWDADSSDGDSESCSPQRSGDGFHQTARTSGGKENDIVQATENKMNDFNDDDESFLSIDDAALEAVMQRHEKEAVTPSRESFCNVPSSIDIAQRTEDDLQSAEKCAGPNTSKGLAVGGPPLSPRPRVDRLAWKRFDGNSDTDGIGDGCKLQSRFLQTATGLTDVSTTTRATDQEVAHKPPHISPTPDSLLDVSKQSKKPSLRNVTTAIINDSFSTSSSLTTNGTMRSPCMDSNHQFAIVQGHKDKAGKARSLDEKDCPLGCVARVGGLDLDSQKNEDNDVESDFEFEEPSTCEEEYDFSAQQKHPTDQACHSRNQNAFGFEESVSGETECQLPLQATETTPGIDEFSSRDKEIDASKYPPEPRVYRMPPMVHSFNIHNRPITTRKSLPVAGIFDCPVRLMWQSKFECFNHLQSEMASSMAYSDDNVVCSAPTGAGKTVIFEMALARFFMVDLQSSTSSTRGSASNRRKAVYISPSKALCEERFEDWSTRLKEMNLGIQVAVITGDGDPSESFSDLASSHFILTTPEKWDSLTRRWTENFYLLASVKLFLVDEVHLIADDSRGCCLESIVARMKVIQQAASRIDFSKEGILRSR